MTDEIKDDMEAPKPPSVPLFKIPDSVLNSMNKEVAPDLAAINNPVEWIIKQRKLAEAQVIEVKEKPTEMPPMITGIPPVPQKRVNLPVVAWGGNNLNEEALTMLFYMVVKEVSKDKKIKKYLKDLNIEIYDINDQLLWP